MTTATESTVFGHPRGLATLFFTEMWERVSYYGMRALLILFMTDAAAGGMGMTTERAGAIYGLYTFGVYGLALIGGWIADRIVGQRRAVLYGGVFIAIGHYLLAIPGETTFYSGLVSIAVGTGLLKPNVSAIVGDLYPETGGRRDAGFSIFYMGINLGAFLGPLVCAWVGEPGAGASWSRWHYGFGVAGVGMTLALVQYVLGQKHLRGAGELKEDSASPERLASARKVAWIGAAIAALIVIAVVLLVRAGTFTIAEFAQRLGAVVAVLAVLYFGWVIGFVCRDSIERRRVGLCAVLFVASVVFWAGFEQAGSSMNLFARDFTDRSLMEYVVPASALQSVNAVFIILLAPVAGLVWVQLGARNPSIPAKFGLGLLLLAVGFVVMMWASQRLPEGAAQMEGLTATQQVGMRWLVATYFFHTVGELCLSPVGLSSVTKLAPARLVGQLMGTWFISMAIGNLVAGLVAGRIGEQPLPVLFGWVAAVTGAVGVLFVALARPLSRLAVGIK
jgi:POT family proton-dependent oligopeptide transporter